MAAAGHAIELRPLLDPGEQSDLLPLEFHQLSPLLLPQPIQFGVQRQDLYLGVQVHPVAVLGVQSVLGGLPVSDSS